MIPGVMEHIKDDRQSAPLMDIKTVSEAVKPVVVFNDEPFSHPGRQGPRSLDKPFDARSLVPIYTANVYLNFCVPAGAEKIKHICVIDKLSNASSYDTLIPGVQHHELVRVHRHPHAVLLDEGTHTSELIPKLLLPRHGIYRMGGEGDEVRGYPEEEEAGDCIQREDFREAFEVGRDGRPETYL